MAATQQMCAELSILNERFSPPYLVEGNPPLLLPQKCLNYYFKWVNELAGIFLVTGVTSNLPTKLHSPYGYGLLNINQPHFIILPRYEVNKTIYLDN